MRGRDFNTGLRGVLFDSRHYERMGSAVWLYAWLVLRQTHQTGSTGWVLGGAPISYKEIEEETGFNVRTLERWMSTLRRHGYVETEPAALGGLIVRITKAKKHAPTRNCAAGGSAKNWRKAANGIRTIAGGVRKSAEGDPQICVADRCDVTENTHIPMPISSSSVEESLEKYEAQSFSDKQTRHQPQTSNAPESNFQLQDQKQNSIQPLTPSCSGERQNQKRHASQELTRQNETSTHDLFAEPGRTPRIRVQPPQQPWRVLEEARSRQQLWRAEREDVLQRELRVGAGPEVRRQTQSGVSNASEVKQP